MICKQCGERMYVRMTLPTGKDSIVRSYYCKKCMSTGDTHETMTSFQKGTNNDNNNEQSKANEQVAQIK